VLAVMSTDYYADGFLLGKAHARPNSNLDPRYTLAAVSREGGKDALDEFMRGFDNGYRDQTQWQEAHEEGATS
jgi:hypothetical protein